VLDRMRNRVTVDMVLDRMRNRVTVDIVLDRMLGRALVVVERIVDGGCRPM
jgi:hypothetical protein